MIGKGINKKQLPYYNRNLRSSRGLETAIDNINGGRSANNNTNENNVDNTEKDNEICRSFGLIDNTFRNGTQMSISGSPYSKYDIIGNAFIENSEYRIKILPNQYAIVKIYALTTGYDIIDVALVVNTQLEWHMPLGDPNLYFDDLINIYTTNGTIISNYNAKSGSVGYMKKEFSTTFYMLELVTLIENRSKNYTLYFTDINDTNTDKNLLKLAIMNSFNGNGNDHVSIAKVFGNIVIDNMDSNFVSVPQS